MSGSRFTIDQLPKRYQNQVAEQIRKDATSKVPQTREAYEKDILDRVDKCDINHLYKGPRLRQERGPKLNKTEAAFERKLKIDRSDCQIVAQGITLLIANGVRYTPDFAAIPKDPPTEVTFYEVKGFMRDDAAVKLKVAAALYPMFRFYLVSRSFQAFTEERVFP